MSPRFPGPRALAFALVCLVMAPTTIDAQEPAAPTKVGTVEGITEYRLPNGLRILLIPDISQPKVTVNLTLFCGSRHEGYGETGMAHLLEHMVFKGCPKFPDVPRALRDHGAQFNGTTWLDRTNYYETMPASDENLEFGLELEADRMINSFIKRDDLVSEFTVVRNEFESGENNPQSILYQRMLASAYEWHNYGKSTIGNRADIERVPIDNLQAFYKKYYRPDNAMLVVAGKFDEKKALAMIAKYFAPIKKPEDPLPKTYTEEPAQDGERSVTLRRVGTVGATGAVYHIPAGPHPDYPACAALEAVLSTEPAGRLYKTLVETKKASNVGGMIFALHDPGAMIFLAQTDPAGTEEARDILIKTLEAIAEKPVTAEEVERVKREFTGQREQLVANSQRLAINLSEWAGAGDWRLFFIHRDRMEKVTAEDVNRVAGKYLIRSNRTVGIFTPTKVAERAVVTAAPEVDTLVKDYKGRDAVASGEAFDPTPANIEARVVRSSVGEGVKTALLTKKTRGETVNLSFVLHFGNEEVLTGKTTAVDYLGSMLVRGTKTRTRQQISDELDKLGARLSISATAGNLSVSIQAKKSTLPAVLAIFSDLLRNSTFPQDEFEILKREKLDGLKQGKTDPQTLAMTALRRKMRNFPATDIRYVPTVDEQIARHEAVTDAQVKELYETMLSSSAGELAIVGDFDAAPTLKQFDEFLKGWTSKVPYKRIESPSKTTVGGVEYILTPDKANAVYLTGLSLPLIDSDAEYPALAIGNYILGGAPLASRLSNRVRGKEGLSYGVGSMVQVSSLEKSGAFMTFAITNPMNIGKVDTTIAEELNKFLTEGVSASELDEAKKGYLQSRQVGRSNDGTLASQLATALNVGRTFTFEAEFDQRVTAVQVDDVKSAFSKYVTPKNLAIIQAGDLPKEKK